MKGLTDFDFEGMSYDNLRELESWFIAMCIVCIIAKLGNTKTRIMFFKNDDDVQEFSKVRYESKWVVDLYVEHYGYDAMDFKTSDAKDYESPNSSDAYCSSDDEEPILGMRYAHPEQLKLALANYRVSGGYQLWFQKNDWRQLLVFCGRDVSKGRCVWYHSKKVKAKKQLFIESNDDAKKGEETSKDGEGSSRNSDVSPKWTKSKIASSRKSGQPQCGFRLWASWMGSENSFQIKSLKAKHKCARNYNLGSLVTYKWIAHHFVKKIIADPFISLLKIKAAIREKFLINVSLRQCKRAKQRALYVFEGGLIEHYGRGYLMLYLIGCQMLNTESAQDMSLLLLKRNSTGVQLQRLFWLAAGTTVKSIFYNNIHQIKAIFPDAYNYLVQRNPNSWSRAFFDLNFKLVQMKTIAMNLEDRIAPSIKKRLEVMKKQQRLWTVVPSGFQDLEVRKGDESFGVNLHLKKYMCRPKKIELRLGLKTIHKLVVGRQNTCSNYYEKGHNRRNCDKEPVPKPPQMKKQPGRKTKPNYPSYASHRGGGRSYKGGRSDASGGRGEASGGRDEASGGIGEAIGGIGKASGGRGQASGGRGQSNAAKFQENTEKAESNGGKGRVRGRGGRSSRSRGRGGREMSEDEIRKNMELEYMEQVLIKEGEKRIAVEKANKKEFDEEAVRLTLEEEARYAKLDHDRSIEEEEFEYNQQWYNHILIPQKSASTMVEWKTIESNAAEPPNLKKQGRKRKVAKPGEAEPLFRIYHKNRGRSERIFNQKMKKTGFSPNGEGSTTDKAFSL
nr:chloramphenicol acetyltransferase-like domain-containing protein [Tanacetum cinerariifolium]